MNKKQTIKLNESQLKRIVSESVKKVLKEGRSKNKNTIAVWSDKDSDIEVYKEFMNAPDAIDWATELVHGQYYNSGKRVVLNVGVIYETLDNYDEMKN